MKFYDVFLENAPLNEDIKPMEKFKSAVSLKIRKRLSIIKNKLLLKKGLERSKQMMPSDKVLKARARKNARRELSRKIAGKQYDDMSDVERKQFSTRLKGVKVLFMKLINDKFVELKKKAKEDLIKSQLSRLKKAEA